MQMRPAWPAAAWEVSVQALAPQKSYLAPQMQKRMQKRNSVAATPGGSGDRRCCFQALTQMAAALYHSCCTERAATWVDERRAGAARACEHYRAVHAFTHLTSGRSITRVAASGPDFDVLHASGCSWLRIGSQVLRHTRWIKSAGTKAVSAAFVVNWSFRSIDSGDVPLPARPVHCNLAANVKAPVWNRCMGFSDKTRSPLDF